VGVAGNKVYAKLGSDLQKPDATTVITNENYRQLVWPLPVSDLLYVGGRVVQSLASIQIRTIGDLANYPARALQNMFGKNGVTLKTFAMGQDESPVEEGDPIKSVGNSATMPHDVTTVDEASAAIYMLSESVAARLRENGLRSRCIGIGVRDTKLAWAGCQHTIGHATALTNEIAKTAIDLFTQRYTGKLPLRSMGVHCSSLVPESAPEQTDLFGVTAFRSKALDLERAVDDIRRRWGNQIIQRAVVCGDPLFTAANLREVQHQIHPVSYFHGAK
jgi:DNA polymerase-4